jgi:hypothetical protein
MGQTHGPDEPDQLPVLPPTLPDWLLADHVVCFLPDRGDLLALTTITSRPSRRPRGPRPPTSGSW